MTGHTLLHGLLLLANLSLLFSCLVQLFVSEANARRKNNWTCSIWCRFIHRNNQRTHIHHTHNKSIHNKLSMALSTDQHQVTTTIERAINWMSKSATTLLSCRTVVKISFSKSYLVPCLIIISRKYFFNCLNEHFSTSSNDFMASLVKEKWRKNFYNLRWKLVKNLFFPHFND